jgi:hypothetical protein
MANIYLPGLKGTEYDGYFDGIPDWFSSATPTGNTELRSDFSPVDPPPGNGFSWEWTGYFKPLSAEGFIEDDFTFAMNSDDLGIMWIGAPAVAGFDTSNKLVSAFGYDQSAPVSLRADTLYPVRIQFGHPVPPTAVGLYIQANPTRRMANDFVSGCLFHSIPGGNSGKATLITGKTKIQGCKVKIKI